MSETPSTITCPSGSIAPSTSPADELPDMIRLLRALLATYPNPADAGTERVRVALARVAEVLERVGPSLATPEYEILEAVGRGGMGIIYRAWQPALKRVVALKVLTDGAASSPARLQRFRIEAEAAARLRHPNIVQIHAIGEGADGPWLALEWVEGGGLDLRLRQGGVGRPGGARPGRDPARAGYEAAPA